MARAIGATFKRRKTEIPAVRPDALTAVFAEDAAKQPQWTAFVEGIEAKPGALGEVIEALAVLLMPQAEMAGGAQG